MGEDGRGGFRGDGAGEKIRRGTDSQRRGSMWGVEHLVGGKD